MLKKEQVCEERVNGKLCKYRTFLKQNFERHMNNTHKHTKVRIIFVLNDQNKLRDFDL
jgi:hypothetical protein